MQDSQQPKDYHEELIQKQRELIAAWESLWEKAGPLLWGSLAMNVVLLCVLYYFAFFEK